MSSAEIITDISSSVSQAFYIAAIEMDGGVLILGDHAANLGGDIVVPAIIRWSQISEKSTQFEVARDILPDWVGYWTNRRIEVWEVLPTSRDAMDGVRKFTGIVESEPAERVGVLAVQCGPSRIKPVTIPDGVAIDKAAYPKASDSAVGALKPWVFGTLEECPLIPVQVPAYTTLAEPAGPGDQQLVLNDATGFGASGSVVVDGLTYSFTARDDRTLMGMTITGAHASGTTVAEAGGSVYLAAGHPVSAITAIKAGENVLTDGVVDLNAATVTFGGIPKKVEVGQIENVEINFDEVLAGNTALNGINAIQAAVGSRVQSATSGTNIPVDIDYVPAYEDGVIGVGLKVKKPLDVTISIPPAVAGTYEFLLTLEPPKDTSLSTVTYVQVGGVTHEIRYQHPTQLTFNVPVSAGQTAVSLRHYMSGQSFPADYVTGSSLITRVQARLAASSGLPPATTGRAEVVFDRPVAISGTDRIITGVYTVGFVASVASHIPAAGAAYVKVAGQVVWAWHAGQVVFNNSPASVRFDDNVDRLPVEVVYEGSLEGGVTVQVTSAQRTVALGNLDEANYATLRKGTGANDNRVLKVRQNTANPNRGRIKKARLVVEYATAAATPDTVTVDWDGKALGALNARNEASGGSSSYSINVDTVSSGTGTLRSRDVGGIAPQAASKADQSISVPINTPISYTTKTINATSGYVQLYGLTSRIALPANVIAGTYPFNIGWTSSFYSGNVTHSIGGSGVTPSSSVINVTISNGQQYLELISRHIFHPSTDYIQPAIDGVLTFVSGTVLCRPTQNAITVFGGGYTGSPTLNTQTSDVVVYNDGVTIGNTGSNVLTVTYPGSPRTVVNTFDLPFVRDWSDLTNKTLTLTYGGSGTADINVVLAYIGVDYEPLTYAPTDIGALTATVTGLSGNPADIFKLLAEKAGHSVAYQAYLRLNNWATNKGYQFARRVADTTSVTDLMQLAADQLNARIVSRDDGLACIRTLDFEWPDYVITDRDITEPLTVEWAPYDDLSNEVIVQYRHINDESTRTHTVNAATPNKFAARGERSINERKKIEVDARWISSDATVQSFAKDYIQLNAPLRRRVSAKLTYAFDMIEEGDIAIFDQIDATCRVTSVTRGPSTVTIEAEEIPL